MANCIAGELRVQVVHGVMNGNLSSDGAAVYITTSISRQLCSFLHAVAVNVARNLYSIWLSAVMDQHKVISYEQMHAHGIFQF